MVVSDCCQALSLGYLEEPRGVGMILKCHVFMTSKCLALVLNNFNLVSSSLSVCY